MSLDPPVLSSPVPDFDYSGQTFDSRYLLLDRIGCGAMGVVYRAAHAVLGNKLAIKVLRRDFATDPRAVERFVREATAAAKIGHSGIVRVFDFGTTADDCPYFTMELVEGDSLRQRLEQIGAFAVEDALRIARGIAEIIGAAHTHGIIHRDLKPENVFLVPDGDDGERVKILDFGIAKVVADRVARLTQTGMIFGTPDYMAPEQALGRAVDVRTDIYALGVLLYEMLCGKHPFDGSAMEVMAKHVYVAPPPLEKQRAELAAHLALEALVHRMLAKNPAARPETMSVVMEEIATLGLALRTEREFSVRLLPAPSTVRDASAALPRAEKLRPVGVRVRRPPRNLASLGTAARAVVALRRSSQYRRALPPPMPEPVSSRAPSSWVRGWRVVLLALVVILVVAWVAAESAGR